MSGQVTSQILFLILMCAGCYGLIDIKKYLKVCERNSADTNDCLVDAIQDGLAVLCDGIPELGAPRVDPYHQKELRAEYNNNQIMAKMIMKDIYVEGLREAKVHDARLRADEDRFHLEVDMTAPHIYVKGKYTGEGRYNSLKINAAGVFNTTMSDLVFTWKLDGTPEKSENGTFVRITSFYMRPDVGDMKSLLINNNPESRDIVNLGSKVVNENWRPMYRELLPVAQANWNKIGIRVANKIFLKIPYDILFPIAS